MNKTENYRLWWIFFIYTFCISCYVQIIALPYVFPSFHAGNGLMNISFDSIAFHRIAIDMANKIMNEGWAAWQLKPRGQFPAGVSSIFYRLIMPDPRILIPISAAMHASAAMILVNLMNMFLKSKIRAILCALPFLIFPSNMQWTAQWHRDGFSILGLCLILYGVVHLFMIYPLMRPKWYLNLIRFAIYCTAGFFLVWLARPYLLSVIKPVIALFLVLICTFMLIGMFKNTITWKGVLTILFPVLLVSSITLFSRTAYYKNDYGKGEKEKILNTCKEKAKDGITASDNLKKLDMTEFNWKRSSLIPQFIDKQAYSLAVARRGFRLSFPDAGSNIDEDIGFTSVSDILIYLPRAFQIALLAPFPTQWFCKGVFSASSLMRGVSACEMLVVYFSLIFLPYALWHWRRRIEIWVIFIFCIYMLLIHALTICNVGTLYRMRYPYITILAALGIAGFIALLDNIKIKKRVIE